MIKAFQATTSENPSPFPAQLVLPKMSSQTLGWKPLIVEEFQQPPGAMEYLEAWPKHTITLCLATHPHRIHQIVGERRYTGLYSKGDLTITPAGLPAAYQAEGNDHYLQIQIPSQFLQQVAQEELTVDANGFELVTEFRVRDQQIEQILLMLRSELHQGGGLSGQLYLESLANVLAIHLLRKYSTSQPCVAVYKGGLGDRKILQVLEYIYTHLNQDIKLADLAASAGISPFHFSRLFKQSMGMSPHQYLLQQRVERAKQLLKSSQLTIADIALQCGFNSQSHLGKSFRELTGITPSNYRKS